MGNYILANEKEFWNLSGNNIKVCYVLKTHAKFQYVLDKAESGRGSGKESLKLRGRVVYVTQNSRKNLGSVYTCSHHIKLGFVGQAVSGILVQVGFRNTSPSWWADGRQGMGKL